MYTVLNVSSTMISQITDKIIPKAIEWQNRPLHTVYPLVFIDCVHYNVKKRQMSITNLGCSLKWWDDFEKKRLFS